MPLVGSSAAAKSGTSLTAVSGAREVVLELGRVMGRLGARLALIGTTSDAAAAAAASARRDACSLADMRFAFL